MTDSGMRAELSQQFLKIFEHRQYWNGIIPKYAHRERLYMYLQDVLIEEGPKVLLKKFSTMFSKLSTIDNFRTMTYVIFRLTENNLEPCMQKDFFQEAIDMLCMAPVTVPMDVILSNIPIDYPYMVSYVQKNFQEILLRCSVKDLRFFYMKKEYYTLLLKHLDEYLDEYPFWDTIIKDYPDLSERILEKAYTDHFNDIELVGLPIYSTLSYMLELREPLRSFYKERVKGDVPGLIAHCVLSQLFPLYEALMSGYDIEEEYLKYYITMYFEEKLNDVLSSDSLEDSEYMHYDLSFTFEFAEGFDVFCDYLPFMLQKFGISLFYDLLETFGPCKILQNNIMDCKF